MIEVPRGALTADEIAQTAEFFSFGTNDLTQTALGMSRDDIRHLPACLTPRTKSFKKNPFATHRPDRRRPAHEDRRRERPQDPPRHQARHLRRTRRRSGSREVLPPARPRTTSAARPYRVPVARLAAAQAAIADEKAVSAQAAKPAAKSAARPSSRRNLQPSQRPSPQRNLQPNQRRRSASKLRLNR